MHSWFNGSALFESVNRNRLNFKLFPVVLSPIAQEGSLHIDFLKPCGGHLSDCLRRRDFDCATSHIGITSKYILYV